MKMVTSCLCLAFLLFSHSAHAQWSQSLGWGSAGNGKRSLVEPAAGFSDSDWCNSISNLQKLINALQRGKRVCMSADEASGCHSRTPMISGMRIYLKIPQCLQWNYCQERPNSRQIAILGSGLFMLVILTIIFIQSRLTKHERHSKPEFLYPANPPVVNGKIDKTAFSYGPNVHYGIVLDCGSSGTRVYVYIWPPHSGNPRDLLNIQQLKDQDHQPVVKKITPGLDTFEDHPEEASEYLRPLLEFAASHIPPEHHKETLLYILATAGMRMVPVEAQNAILQDLQRDIPKDFSFVISENNFEVISGKQEGVYAWIAVNYVLHKFGHGEEEHPLVAVEIPGENTKLSPHIRRRTVGMIDMGGGSMQIAFEVTSKIDDIPKHLLAEFNLGCHNSDIEHTYRVYVTTFLGYGANEARSRYEDLLVSQRRVVSPRAKRAAVPASKQQLYQKSTSNNKTVVLQKLLKVTTTKKPLVFSRLSPEILDPCLPQGMVLEGRENPYYKFKGLGDYHKCQEALIPLLNASVPCPVQPCTFNGVYQPEINFYNSEFYGFSEFWYTMEDVYRIGGQYEADIFDAQAKEFCSNQWSSLKGWWDKNLYPKADDQRLKLECFKSAWMTTVLHKGFKFPEKYRHFQSAQYIHNKDVQWTLGALIHRTRYLPLRDLEKLEMSHSKPSWVGKSQLFYNEYLLVICFLVVVTAILLYIKRLKLCSKVTTADLSRVPSMSYFMTDVDQTEPGVRFAKNYTYP